MFKEMSLYATTASTTIKTDIIGGDGLAAVSQITTSSLNHYNITVDETIQTIINSTSTTVDQHDSDNDMFELSKMCIKGLIFGTIIVGAVLGNALVIISVHKNRKLR